MPIISSSFEIPPCHEAKTSPEQWNAAFEELFSNITAKHYLISIILEDRMSPNKRQGKLEEYLALVRNLCELQLRVSLLAISAMDADDLATEWLNASLEVREKHVLSGLAGVCAISPNLNQARLSCAKELRVSYLSTNGHILLELINALAPHDLTQVPANPQYINNVEWDILRVAHKNSQDEVEMLALAHILVLRSKLITHTVHFVICSFLGHELPRISVQMKAHSHNKATPTRKPWVIFHEVWLEESEKRDSKKIDVHKAAYKERTAEKVNICSGCSRKARTQETFKRCGGCCKIDREVLYCSEQCQRANWKQHKLMCGKPLDYDSLFYDAAMKFTTSPTTSKNISYIPPPANGFKPPLELRLQMKYLKDYPTFDYVVLRNLYTNGEKYALLTWRNSFIGPIFRQHRDNAMKSGDRVSAALICDCVLWDIEVRKVTDFCREKVVDQFSREYKFPVAELEVALEEMRNFRASIHNRFPALVRGQI